MKIKMKKSKIVISFIVSLFLIHFLAASASASGGAVDSYRDYTQSEELFSALDDETKELLRELGITDIELNELFDIGFRRVMETFFDLLSGSLRDKAMIFTSLIGAMLTLSIASSVCRENNRKGIEITGYCTLVLIISVPLISLLSSIRSVFVSALGFMKVFIPVYAAVIAASGKPTLALSFNTAVLALGEFIVYFVENIYSPFTGMILCLSFVGGISDFLDIKSIISGLKKGITFILGLAATLFSGILSVKGVLAGNADSVGAKGVKFLIGSSVPVVGSSVSEAFSSIMAGLSLIKSTVGVFGIIAIFAIFLPVIIEIIAWMLIINISCVLAKTLGCERESSLLYTLGSCVSLLLAGIAITLTVLIVSCGIILKIA